MNQISALLLVLPILVTPGATASPADSVLKDFYGIWVEHAETGADQIASISETGSKFVLALWESPRGFNVTLAGLKKQAVNGQN